MSRRLQSKIIPYAVVVFFLELRMNKYAGKCRPSFYFPPARHFGLSALAHKSVFMIM